MLIPTLHTLEKGNVRRYTSAAPCGSTGHSSYRPLLGEYGRKTLTHKETDLELACRCKTVHLTNKVEVQR